MGKTLNTGNLTNAIAQDSSNNIGIGGSASGSYKFQVTGTTNLTDALTGTSATFSTGVALSSAGGSNQLTSFVNTSSLHSGSAGLNVFGFNGSNNIYFGKGLTNGGVFLWTNSEVRYYTLPNATGTIALTSDLGSYLPLSGGTLTGNLTLSSASTPLLQIVDTTNSKSLLFGADDSNTFIRSSSSTPILFQVNGGDTALTLASNQVATFSNNIMIGAGKYLGYSASAYMTPEDNIQGARVKTSGGFIVESAGATFSSTISTKGGLTIVRSNTSESSVINNEGNLIYNARDNYNHVFQGNGTELARITSSGNVGIGTSSPGASLETVSAYNASIWAKSTNNEVPISAFNSSNSRATIGFKGSTSTNEYNVRVGADGNDFIAYTSNTERMRITGGGYTKISNNGTYVGSTASYHEINQSANSNTLFVKATDASYTETLIVADTTRGAGTACLFLFGLANGVNTIKIFNNGNIQNTNNSYGAISDIKLKENIIDATPKLDDLLKVKIRNYNLIGDETKQIGVIAQEIEQIFPSIIDETEDFEEIEIIDEDGNVTKEKQSLGTTTKSVKYSVFVPMLIKAIQEQQQQIEELKALIKI